jgi:hypothetical protein
MQNERVTTAVRPPTSRGKRAVKPSTENQTTYFGEDAILAAVRAHFEALAPGVSIREVRFTLDGVAVDHAPSSAAAAG